MLCPFWVTKTWNQRQTKYTPYTMKMILQCIIHHELSWVPTIHSFHMVLKFLEFLNFSHKSMQLILFSLCGIELLIMHQYASWILPTVAWHIIWKSCWLFSFWFLDVCISLLEILSFTWPQREKRVITLKVNTIKVNWPLEEIKQLCLQISKFALSSTLVLSLAID